MTNHSRSFQILTQHKKKMTTHEEVNIKKLEYEDVKLSKAATAHSENFVIVLIFCETKQVYKKIISNSTL